MRRYARAGKWDSCAIGFKPVLGPRKACTTPPWLMSTAGVGMSTRGKKHENSCPILKNTYADLCTFTCPNDLVCIKFSNWFPLLIFGPHIATKLLLYYAPPTDSSVAGLVSTLETRFFLFRCTPRSGSEVYPVCLFGMRHFMPAATSTRYVKRGRFWEV